MNTIKKKKDKKKILIKDRQHFKKFCSSLSLEKCGESLGKVGT